MLYISALRNPILRYGNMHLDRETNDIDIVTIVISTGLLIFVLPSVFQA